MTEPMRSTTSSAAASSALLLRAGEAPAEPGERGECGEPGEAWLKASSLKCVTLGLVAAVRLESEMRRDVEHGGDVELPEV